eukprot:4323282-Alexandrium_andersonii.AAC.1
MRWSALCHQHSHHCTDPASTHWCMSVPIGALVPSALPPLHRPGLDSLVNDCSRWCACAVML